MPDIWRMWSQSLIYIFGFSVRLLVGSLLGSLYTMKFKTAEPNRPNICVRPHPRDASGRSGIKNADPKNFNVIFFENPLIKGKKSANFKYY